MKNQTETRYMSEMLDQLCLRVIIIMSVSGVYHLSLLKSHISTRLMVPYFDTLKTNLLNSYAILLEVGRRRLAKGYDQSCEDTIVMVGSSLSLRNIYSFNFGDRLLLLLSRRIYLEARLPQVYLPEQIAGSGG